MMDYALPPDSSVISRPGGADPVGAARGACGTCGSEGECGCGAIRRAVSDRAEALKQMGLEAARAGRLVEARSLLEQSVLCDAGDEDAWTVLGLCALATGDPVRARSAWAAAVALAPQGDATRWLNELDDGRIAKALRKYEEAVAACREERWADARRALEVVHDTLPQFVPAGRLRGILHSVQGEWDEARAVWREQLALCRDDSELLRLLGDNFGVRPTEEQAAVSRRRRSARRAVVGGAAIAAVLLAGVMAVSATPRSEAGAITWSTGAAPAVARASHPDSLVAEALALLAYGHAARGDSAAARAAAAELVRRYPRSSFADSAIRRLSGAARR